MVQRTQFQELREQCLTEQTKRNLCFVTCNYDGKDNRGILWAREVSRVEGYQIKKLWYDVVRN